jgi:hypothetical protein
MPRTERQREKRRAYRKRKVERKRAAQAKAERIERANRPRMSIHDAAAFVPDDLPDGAYFAMLGEFTGMDAGGVASAMASEFDEDD